MTKLTQFFYFILHKFQQMDYSKWLKN